MTCQESLPKYKHFIEDQTIPWDVNGFPRGDGSILLRQYTERYTSTAILSRGAPETLLRSMVGNQNFADSSESRGVVQPRVRSLRGYRRCRCQTNICPANACDATRPLRSKDQRSQLDQSAHLRAVPTRVSLVALRQSGVKF